MMGDKIKKINQNNIKNKTNSNKRTGIKLKNKINDTFIF
jgi:hypothetical protein